MGGRDSGSSWGGVNDYKKPPHAGGWGDDHNSAGGQGFDSNWAKPVRLARKLYLVCDFHRILQRRHDYGEVARIKSMLYSHENLSTVPLLELRYHRTAAVVKLFVKAAFVVALCVVIFLV